MGSLHILLQKLFDSFYRALYLQESDQTKNTTSWPELPKHPFPGSSEFITVWVDLCLMNYWSHISKLMIRFTLHAYKLVLV